MSVSSTRPVLTSPELACSQQDKPQAVLLPGDLSYADDYNLDDRFGYQPRWDAWGRLSQKLFGTVPLVSGIGAQQHSRSLSAPTAGRLRIAIQTCRRLAGSRAALHDRSYNCGPVAYASGQMRPSLTTCAPHCCLCMRQAAVAVLDLFQPWDPATCRQSRGGVGVCVRRRLPEAHQLRLAGPLRRRRRRLRPGLDVRFMLRHPAQLGH